MLLIASDDDVAACEGDGSTHYVGVAFMASMLLQQLGEHRGACLINGNDLKALYGLDQFQ
jgi:hypothetical protein